MTKKNNVKECRKDILKCLQAGQTVGETIAYIRHKYDLTYNAAQKRVATARKDHSVNTSSDNTSTNTMKVGEVRTQETRFDGKNNETSFKGLIAIEPNQSVSKEYILEQYGLSKSEWTVLSFVLNEWQNQTKEGEPLNLRQFKLTVAPKKDSEYSPLEIQSIINQAIEKCLKKFKIQAELSKAIHCKKTKRGYVVEICLPDIHVGLLAWRRETTEDFDLDIVYAQVMHAIEQIYNKLIAMNIPIKKIIIVTEGDVVHVDNDMQTTTKGTFQQVDGRFPKIVETAYKLLYDIIIKFAELAPVEYIYIPGNHDKNTGWQIAFSLSKVFEKVKGIDVDCEPNPHKYRKIGNVAVGWSHGDANKKNLDGLMNQMVRDQSDVFYKILHLGHLHSSQSHTTVDGSCYIEHLDSLCPASLWEHSQGYGKTPLRYVNCFLYDGTPTPPDRIIGAVASK